MIVHPECAGEQHFLADLPSPEQGQTLAGNMPAPHRIFDVQNTDRQCMHIPWRPLDKLHPAIQLCAHLPRHYTCRLDFKYPLILRDSFLIIATLDVLFSQRVWSAIARYCIPRR